MRQSSALASRLPLVAHPLPARATRQLRLALDMLPQGGATRPAEAEAGTPRAFEIPAPTGSRVFELVHALPPPRLAWPERPARARMADGSPAPRRADFYDWILLRRRRAQLAARRAIADD